jgi:hypothetical protein
MRIHIKSNFVVPGLEEKNSVDVERPRMTLLEFLEELSKMSPTAIEYVRPGADVLDPDDWEVDINGVPYQHCSQGLKAPLKDGDTVTLKILAMGGG